MLPPLIAGKDKACFGVTEPDAGLDTTAIKTARRCAAAITTCCRGQKIWTSTAQVANKILLLARTTPLEEVKRKTDGLTLFYTDLDRSRVEVRVIDKMGRHAVDFERDVLRRHGRSRRQIASARKAKASATSCTASTRSAS